MPERPSRIVKQPGQWPNAALVAWSVIGAGLTIGLAVLCAGCR